MRVNRVVRNIIDKAMVLEHQFDKETVASIVRNSCEAHGIDAKWTEQVVMHVKQKITDLQDFRAGIRDCKGGIYDKWYRYNRKDDGAAYDKGWMQQNKTTIVEKVTFLNA